jgi:hypothetical protein
MDILKLHELLLAAATILLACALVFLLFAREKRQMGPMFTLPLLGDTVALALSEQSRFMFGRCVRTSACDSRIIVQ